MLTTAFEVWRSESASTAFVVDETEIKESDERVGAYRSGVGTLLYIARERPDIQYLAKELAGHLQKPTEVGAHC